MLYSLRDIYMTKSASDSYTGATAERLPRRIDDAAVASLVVTNVHLGN